MVTMTPKYASHYYQNPVTSLPYVPGEWVIESVPIPTGETDIFIVPSDTIFCLTDYSLVPANVSAPYSLSIYDADGSNIYQLLRIEKVTGGPGEGISNHIIIPFELPAGYKIRVGSGYASTSGRVSFRGFLVPLKSV